MKQRKLAFARQLEMGPLSCELSSENGNGRNGPKHPKVGPVREFLVDWDAYYRLVFKHVKAGCKRGCTPDLVLKEYLDRRARLPKFNGETSSGLCRWAERYEKIGATPALVRRFFVRSGDAGLLCARKDLGPEEIVEGVKILYSSWTRKNTQRVELSSWIGSWTDRKVYGAAKEVIKVAADRFNENKPLPPDEELLRLADVAVVMFS